MKCQNCNTRFSVAQMRDRNIVRPVVANVKGDIRDYNIHRRDYGIIRDEHHWNALRRGQESIVWMSIIIVGLFVLGCILGGI